MNAGPVFRLGSSEIASVVGLNKYRSPLQLWAEKTGKVPRQPGNDRMWLGTAIEPLIGRYWSRKKRVPVKHNKQLFASKTHPWAICIPDFFTREAPQRIVECKNKSWRARAEWEFSEGPPDTDIVQVTWQLGICELELGELAALIDNELFDAPIPFDKGLYEQLLEAGETFLNYCQRDIPPEPGPGDSTLIYNLVNRVPDDVAQLSGDAIEEAFAVYAQAAEEKSEADEALKVLNDRIDKAKAVLALALGDRCYGELVGDGQFAGSTVQLKKIERKGYEVKPTSYVTVKVKIIGEDKDGNK